MYVYVGIFFRTAFFKLYSPFAAHFTHSLSLTIYFSNNNQNKKENNLIKQKSEAHFHVKYVVFLVDQFQSICLMEEKQNLLKPNKMTIDT